MQQRAGGCRIATQVAFGERPEHCDHYKGVSTLETTVSRMFSALSKCHPGGDWKGSTSNTATAPA